MSEEFELVDDDGILVIAAAAALRTAASDERSSSDPLAVLRDVVDTHGAAAWQTGYEETARFVRRPVQPPGAVGPWTLHVSDGHIHAMPYSQFTMALMRGGIPEKIEGLNYEMVVAPGWYEVFVGRDADRWSLTILQAMGATHTSLREVVDLGR